MTPAGITIGWLRRPRVSLRWLMVVVAVAAGSLGWRQHRIYQELRAKYQKEAMFCEIIEQYWLRDSQPGDEEVVAEHQTNARSRPVSTRIISGLVSIDSWEPSPTASKIKAEHWARLKSKYEAAARRPWLAIEPDPPEPES